MNDLSRNQTSKSIVHYQPSPYELSLNIKDISDKFQCQPQSRSINNVESYQCWSIFNTLSCCLCLGCMACVYSIETRKLKKQGNFRGALKASKQARNLNIIDTISGIILITLWLRLIVSSFIFHCSSY